MSDYELSLVYIETYPDRYEAFLKRNNLLHGVSSAVKFRQFILNKSKKSKKSKSLPTTKAHHYFNNHKVVWVVGADKGAK